MGRLSSAVLAVWFAVFSVVVPVSAHAAVYNAASNLTGRSWYVPASGTGVAGAAVLATAATALARANPWVAALSIGTPIMQLLMEMAHGGYVQVAAKDALQPAPSGWADSNHPPLTATGTLETTPASTTTSVEQRWQFNSTASSLANAYTLDKTTAKADLHNAYSGCVQTQDSSGWPSSPVNGNTYSAFFVMSGNENTTQNPCPMKGSTVQLVYKPWCQSGNVIGSAGSYSCSVATSYCESGWSLSGSTCVRGTCPNGYSLVNGQCALTDSPLVQWPSDGKATLRLEGTGIGYHPRDPDLMPADISPSVVLNPSRDYSPDPYNQPASSTITPNSDGGYTWTQNLQTTINNQTYTTTNNMTVNNNGVVTSVTTNTKAGGIAENGTVPAQPFPDDYNKEVTQQKILTGEGAADAPAYATTTAATTATELAKVTGKLDELPGQFSSDKSRWFSWVWTPPVGSCAPISGGIHGNTVTWDLCPYVAKIRDVVGYLFAIFGAWVVYGELFRRENA